MIPLVDTHVHLLAGLDDGPATAEEAVAMCRKLVGEGARSAAALAHQNTTYPANTPDALREATAALAGLLKAEKIPLTVYPTAEVMACAEIPDQWRAGQLLSIADRKQFLLVEMPHGLFLDLRTTAIALKPMGLRIVVAHAERYPELIENTRLAEEWVRLGCLIQVTASGLARPTSNQQESTLKDWVRRGIVHCLGSDGHGIQRRPPLLREGYQTLVRWTDTLTADRIGGIFAANLLQGRPVNPPLPPRIVKKKSWFGSLFGR